MVSNLERAKEVYVPILAFLGFKRGAAHCFVKNGFLFEISRAKKGKKGDWGAAGTISHVAFEVDSRAEVDRFYREILLTLPQITIEDPPVNCPEYGFDEFYATYFRDPDGTKLEVVYARPTNERRYRGFRK